MCFYPSVVSTHGWRDPVRLDLCFLCADLPLFCVIYSRLRKWHWQSGGWDFLYSWGGGGRCMPWWTSKRIKFSLAWKGMAVFIICGGWLGCINCLWHCFKKGEGRIGAPRVAPLVYRFALHGVGDLLLNCVLFLFTCRVGNVAYTSVPWLGASHHPHLRYGD